MRDYELDIAANSISADLRRREERDRDLGGILNLSAMFN